MYLGFSQYVAFSQTQEGALVPSVMSLVCPLACPTCGSCCLLRANLRLSEFACQQKPSAPVPTATPGACPHSWCFQARVGPLSPHSPEAIVLLASRWVMSESDRTLILSPPVLLSCFLLVPSLKADCRCERSTMVGAGKNVLLCVAGALSGATGRERRVFRQRRRARLG